MVNVNGADTTGIVNIVANKNFIFAAVRESGDGDFAGASVDGGIAVVGLNPTTLAVTQAAAIPSDSGIKARNVNNTTPEIVIAGTPEITENVVALHWDDQLQRLYIGLQLLTETSGGGAANDRSRAIIVAQVDTTGELTFTRFFPDAALPGAGGVRVDLIIAGRQDVDEPVAVDVFHIRTLHATTGTSYLIVNSGVTIDPALPPRHFIHALPLVDLQDPSIVTQGTLADKNTAPVACRFTTAAAAEADLTSSVVDAFSIVGAGPIPIPPDGIISDIQTVHDAVYVSIGTAQTDNSEAGIFYSHIQSDTTGQIVRWTPWTKRAFPANGFPDDAPLIDPVEFFAVDAVTAKVWAVDGTTHQTVRLSSWTRNSSGSALVAAAAAAVPCGTFSVLDLHQGVRDFGGPSKSRYALFGGTTNVVFTRVTESRFTTPGPFDIDTAGSEPEAAAQLVITDFTDADNFLDTTLPDTSCGCVTVLEYSKRPSGTEDNYFFAGTCKGLFVFAKTTDGAGFNVASLDPGHLDIMPFSVSSWQKAPSITGAVIDIKTIGNSLYVLTYETSATVPMKTKLFRIPFLTTIATMFAPGNIFLIAESGVGPTLGATQVFTSIQVIPTNAMATTEQVVLATNFGLFRSKTGGGVQTAMTQAAAMWTAIMDSGMAMYLRIPGPETPYPLVYSPLSIVIIDESAPSTVWPISVQDTGICNIFNRGSIHQLHGTVDAGPFAFKPIPFNASSTTAPAPAPFTNFDPFTTFWTDGGRRLFALNQESCGFVHRLHSIPFDTTEWCLTAPFLISDFAVNNVPVINWIKQIGATGILMVGTNDGLLALE